MATIPFYIGHDSQEKESGAVIMKESTAEFLFKAQEDFEHEMRMRLFKNGEGYHIIIWIPEKVETIIQNKLDNIEKTEEISSIDNLEI